MTRINLLPPEIKGKAEKLNLVPWIVISLLVVVVLISALWLYFHNQVSSKQDELQSEEARLEEIKKKVEEPLRVYEEQAAELQSIQGLYATCNAGRVGWASMLNDLALYVPEGLTTASNSRAPAIWLTSLSIDATSLEGQEAASSTAAPIIITGYAAPAWLCIQTWLPRASDFKAHGFLDAYPYYYYFRGQPKVAEFYVRLQNMEEWSNLWIVSSTQEPVTIVTNYYEYDEDGTRNVVEDTYEDWAISFEIQGFWNAQKAPWEAKTKGAANAGSTGTSTGSTGSSTESSTGGGGE